jgi:hypothetical protein
MNTFIALGTSARPPMKKIAAISPTASASALNQNDDAHSVNAEPQCRDDAHADQPHRCEGSAWRSRGRSISGARSRVSGAGASARGGRGFEGRGAGLDIPAFYRSPPVAHGPKSGAEPANYGR